MAANLTVIDAGVFTVSGLFTPLECQELIARGEAIGFEAASVTTSSGPQMMTNIHETKVAATIGMGLFFVHERKHEGAPVTHGRKYVLRTDVMYERAG